MTTALGQLGLWLHMRGQGRGRGGDDLRMPEIPAGRGPALILHVASEAAGAEPQVTRRLMRLRPDLRVVRLGPAGQAGDDPATDPGLVRQLLDEAQPKALLLLGSALPAALIAAAEERGLPVVLAEARLDPGTGPFGMAWGLEAQMRRQLIQRMAAVLVTDAASEAAARRMGVAPDRLAMPGPVTDIREPLRCSEAERAAMAQMLDGRHAWFAAAVPEAEEDAVLAAHEAALHRSHRALLIIAPRDGGRVDALAAQVEAAGLATARRTEEEDPSDDVQVLVTDGTTEMGLWYRLAPVSFMGGTLSGDDGAARHPFEPAALGSAIIHGPATGSHATEWQQLDRAQAARAVTSADELALAVGELTSAELIAGLAHNAWRVSTGGAGVAMRIADAVFEALARAETPAAKE